jgi:DNA mismatch repair protein MutL
VIENPASVVKELVENSIDAGATSIIVEIEEGGRKKITIIDDGCGMGREDALICFHKHTTSKVADFNDLFSLETMGFRGEALASIASVSICTLRTKELLEEKGILLKLEGGVLQEEITCTLPQGTRIDVEDIFYNVPARKAFQKAPSSDQQAVLKWMMRFAMAYPQCAFTLKCDGKKLFFLPGNAEASFHFSLEKRISYLLGDTYFNELIALEEEASGIHLKGFLSKPPFSKSNRSGQYLFLNKRAVDPKLIEKGVLSGYSTALPERRHPFFVLHLDVPPSSIDVNVHPQKQCVRFKEELKIEQLLSEIVFRALQKGLRPKNEPEIKRTCTKNFFSFTPPIEKTGIAIPLQKVIDTPRPLLEKIEVKERVLATMVGYILVESQEGDLKILDQRKAHSRILYESLEKEDFSLFSMRLLIPQTVEYTLSEAELIKVNLNFLKKCGFDLEEFGKNAFIIRSTPSFWEVQEVKSALLELVEKELSFKEEHKKNLCHKVSKQALSNARRLSKEEASILLKALQNCTWPHISIKGEPLFVILDKKNINRLIEGAHGLS